MRKQRPMPLESIIPNVLAGEGQPLAASAPAAAMDNEQFAAFYARSARSLWAYIARVSRDPALADDLTQESYVRFLCATVPEDGEVAARRYLFKIATNLLRDHWRRPRSSSIEEMPEELFLAKCGAAQAESKVMLSPAMAQMRPRDRQLLVAGVRRRLFAPRNCGGDGAGLGEHPAAAFPGAPQDGAPSA